MGHPLGLSWFECSMGAASANLPSYGLSLDAVAVRVRFGHGKERGMCVLRGGEGKG